MDCAGEIAATALSWSDTPEPGSATINKNMETVEGEFQRLLLLLGPLDQLDIPTELLLMIVERVDDYDLIPTLKALSCTSRRLNDIFEPLLYKEDARRCLASESRDRYNRRIPPRNPKAWIDGAIRNLVLVMEKSLKAARSLGLQIDVDRQCDIPYPRLYKPRTKLDRSRVSYASAIHVAAYLGNNDVIKYLSQLGASFILPATRIHGQLCECTRFAHPVANNSADETAWLHPVVRGWLPLHYALCQGHSTTAELLIEKGAPGYMAELRPSTGTVDGEPPLNFMASHSAAEADHADWVYRLIQRKVAEKAIGWTDHGEGYDPDATPVIDRIGPRGTPLHHAIAANHRNTEEWMTGARFSAERLLELGANINISSPEIPSPLSFALSLGAWHIASKLLHLGASVTPEFGDPAIFPAIWSEKQGDCYGCGREVPKSERSGPNVDEDAWYIEEDAIHFGPRDDIIKQIIIKGGLKLDACYTAKGETPLTYVGRAALYSNCHVDTIPFLLGLGAGINQQDANGNTVLHSLASSVSKNAGLFQALLTSVRYVLDHGGSASLQTRNKGGQTPVDCLVARMKAGGERALFHCSMLAHILIAHPSIKDSPQFWTAWQATTEWHEWIIKDRYESRDSKRADGSDAVDWERYM
ncbi:Ankyrin repeat-containing domain protein [Naviculisporaceae sp. PSN 640]